MASLVMPAKAGIHVFICIGEDKDVDGR
ncbi:MAG: hypothetical protein JWO48_2710, partial [Bryobacterales bacterium]|nr:hypothetical protein [Bryobacterales bacterium]